VRDAQFLTSRSLFSFLSRYSLVITPVNYSLAAVNFFVGTTGLAQLYRIWE
jgi:Mitochondrial pyruvate carriers